MESAKAGENSGNGRRLVLFPLPFHGHMTPMFHLATGLHSKGFSITIVHTTFGSPNPARYPQFGFRCIEDGLGDAGISDENLIGIFNLLNRNCLTPFTDCLSELLCDSGVACLISDPMWMFPDHVARSFGLRHLVLRTGSVFATSIYSSIRFLIDKGYYSVKDTSPEKPLLEFPPLKVKDLPVLHGDTKQAHLDHFSNYAAAIRKSSGFICNSFEELEPEAMTWIREELRIPVFPIGPIHKYSPTNACSALLQDDETSLSWLDTQAPRSVLFVSYGSTASINEADFLEIAWALARSNQPFLWAVRPGLIRNSKWIDPLPDGFMKEVAGRGHIVRWAPQQRVLAHPAVGGFLSHCGWNSVLESVSEGVPLICLPGFADQMMNARCASDGWGVGIRVEEGPSRDGIESAIRRLMKGREGEDIRARMSEFKDKADVALKECGSSFQALQELTAYILSV